MKTHEDLTVIESERFDDKRIAQSPWFVVQLPCQLWNEEEKSDGTVLDLNLSTQGYAITAEHLPSILTYVSLYLAGIL
jgi:hypothetical protein